MKEVGGIDNGEDKQGWKVNGQDGIQYPSLQDQDHLDAVFHHARIVVCKGPVGDQVLGENGFRLHPDHLGGDLHHRPLQLPHDQVHLAHLKEASCWFSLSDLGVERVELQLISALERLCVDLLESDPVELTLEDVDLLNVVVGAPDVVAFPGQRQLGVLCSLSRLCRGS